MSIILSGLIHLFRPLLSSLSGALDCEGLGPWYFLLGLRIVAIFFSNGPWDKAKEDVVCNWIAPVQEKALAFCTALCNNQHFAISISATWGLVFLLNLLYVGLMRLSNPEEKKEEGKEKEDKAEKEKDKGLSIVATAPHSGVADISTVYNVGPHGLPRSNGYDDDDDDEDEEGDYHHFPHHAYHPYWAHWHMGHMGEGYGSVVPFNPYGAGGYGGGAYGMPSNRRYGMPTAGGGPSLPAEGGYGGSVEGGYGGSTEGGYDGSTEGGYGGSTEGGYTTFLEEGYSVTPEEGHVMPDHEGRSVPADETCDVLASGGYNVPADGGYGMPVHPGHHSKTKTPARYYNTAQRKMGVGPMDGKQTKMAAHQRDTSPLRGRIKQSKAASRSNEMEQYKVPAKSVPLPMNSSPYRNKYKKATKCRPVIESNVDGKENMALKRRQVHRNNMPNMAAPGPPFCCHGGTGCSCAENASCPSAAQGEPRCQPCCGAVPSHTGPIDSGPGTQENAKKIINNFCGVPFFDIWVGFLLATEIAFLCVIIVLQMPSLLSRSWVCVPRATSCPPSVDCVVRGRAEKRVALWGLALTSCLFIVACSGYFYLRTCGNQCCSKCCGGGGSGNQVEGNTGTEGRVTRGDVEACGRQTAGGQ